MKRILSLPIFCLVLCCLFLLPDISYAQDESPLEPDQVVWSVEAKVKQLFDSYTSYEFAHPEVPVLSPLSRLEFSLDSLWGGVEVKRWTPKWSVSLEAMTNVQKNVEGIMADSDWENPNHPKMRTTYSESTLRLEPSYMVNASADVSVARLLSLPKGLDLRPAAGIRWQYFYFVTSDLNQWGILPDGRIYKMYIPGDGIRFKQTYWHYFAGLRLDWQPMPEKNPGLKLSLEADWAYVKGKNKDHHLLREGNRITEETTDGHAWHAALSLDVPLTENFSIGAQAEYMTIDTSGSHRWFHDAPGYEVDETWSNGVNVWSQQCSFSLMCTYYF